MMDFFFFFFFFFFLIFSISTLWKGFCFVMFSSFGNSLNLEK